jgi:hypothetical protein
VAFLRFSRDKRGYEHFYLVEPVTNRKGKSRPRVLYWYRTPPNVKVGRPPFDDQMRRAIEAQYPDVEFDWSKIVEAPIPSADAEKWRERRRVERAERAVRKSNATADADQESESPEEPDQAASLDEQPIDTEPSSPVAGGVESGGDPKAGQSPAHESGDRGRGVRKRRRRRGGGQPAPNAPVTATATTAATTAAATAAAAAESPIDPSGSTVDEHASDDAIDEPSGE